MSVYVYPILHLMCLRRISDRTDQIYVVTSDQERAIQNGLRTSQMDNYSVQYFCGLHAKWNVRDHVCSNGVIFGKRYAEMWGRMMQRAEGPNSYEFGYRKMLRNLENDMPRTEYVQQLYHDDHKSYFKLTLQFSNAVLVDVCEILFSATKTWVLGKSRRGVSLLMALVRIVEGCRNLMSKPFTTPLHVTQSYVRKKTKNSSILGLFMYLSNHLTHWSVVSMYDTVDKSWNRFNVNYVPRDDTIMITRK